MIHRSNPVVRHASSVLLFILFTTGCSLLAQTPSPTVSASPVTTLATPIAFTSLSLTPTPTLSVYPTPSSVVTSPAEIIEDLSPYRRAMLPDFAAEVDAVAATGASRYNLSVRLEPLPYHNGDWRLTGTEQVRYTNTETGPLAEIYFHLYPNLPGYDGLMQVDTVNVDGQPAQPVLEKDNSVLRVPLPHPLTPGQTTDLYVIYNAVVPGQTDQGYNIFSASDDTLALAGFYPAIAVYDETGWNIKIPPPYGDATYLDTSLYQVMLTVPQSLVVAASGSLLNTQANGDGSKTLSLVSGPMRDFYLAARANFKVASEVVDGTVINSYYYPDQETGGQAALRYAAESLRVFNQCFGRYPYAELDLAATPTTAGGVEYPGMVVIAQRLYSDSSGFFQHAVAHEVAHQWWYGLVGNDQVDDPWLDEALTNYSTIFYWEAAEGQTGAQKVEDVLFSGPYEAVKKQGKDRAVMGPVADFSEAEYGAIVYGKGPLFFDALRQEVGEATYFKIMQTYYDENKYKIAHPETLIKVIERVSGRDIDLLIKTWLQNKS